jgi:glutamate carboxypeptidase
MDLKNSPMRALLTECQRREREMIRMLGAFVCQESPSHDKAAVDRFGRLVAAEWRKRGARVQILKQSKRGDHVRAEMWLGNGRPSGRLLVLGHIDTVYPLGTLREMPFRIASGRAWGPGVFDMKGGLVQALAAVDALRRVGIAAKKRFVLLWTSDEEIGSESSRRAIETEARRSDAVLVLEPALGANGSLKTSRKGCGGAEIIASGRAAHAGIEPEKGVNSVHELALQISRIMKLQNARRGVTVQTTMIAGGTASNVIPESASAKVDIRYSRMADAKGIERALKGLRPILSGAQLEVRVGSSRPPLERTQTVRQLFRNAQGLMREMGLELSEAATGGGSDGNFTAALGIPTLDGLGAVGDGAHSRHEHVILGTLPERAALLAGLLATL